MDDTRMMMQMSKDNISCPPFYFHSAMAMNKYETRLYCCPTNNTYDVAQFDFVDDKWIMIKFLKPSKILKYIKQIIFKKYNLQLFLHSQ